MAVEVRSDDRPDRSGARRLLARVTFPIAWTGLALAIAVHAAGVTLPASARYAALLGTAVVLGLPHGAVDHLVVPRALDRSPTVRGVVGFSLAYLAVAGLYAVAWFVAPVASLAGFVLLTWFHWGQGDLYPLAALTDGRHLAGRTERALTVVVRGGLPMLVPLLAFPERYRAVVAAVAGLFGRDARALAPLFEGDVRLALGVGFASVAVLTLSLGYRRAGATRSWLVDAGETALLWTYFATVPPVLAVGLYFAAWHSSRHVVRIVGLDGRSTAALDRGDARLPIRRFARDALPTTLGALALFAALAVAVPADPGSLADLSGLYLVLLAVLTLPHVLVVTWLDRQQGIW